MEGLREGVNLEGKLKFYIILNDFTKAYCIVL